MNSLVELRDLLVKNEIAIKEFNGWCLKVGKDTWTMLDGVYFRNGNPQSLKEKNIFESYKKVNNNVNQSPQTRNWRGISSRNYRK